MIFLLPFFLLKNYRFLRRNSADCRIVVKHVFPGSSAVRLCTPRDRYRDRDRNRDRNRDRDRDKNTDTHTWTHRYTKMQTLRHTDTKIMVLLLSTSFKATLPLGSVRNGKENKDTHRHRMYVLVSIYIYMYIY